MSDKREQTMLASEQVTAIINDVEPGEKEVAVIPFEMNKCEENVLELEQHMANDASEKPAAVLASKRSKKRKQKVLALEQKPAVVDDTESGDKQATVVPYNTSVKRKQTALALEQKMAIINDIESGEKQAAVAAACNLSKQTVNSIWQNRDKLRQAFESCASLDRKRLRMAAFEDVEEALLKWFTVARSQNLPVSGPVLREKAQIFARLLKHDTFQCSGGWLDRFKTRHNIVFCDVCGETASVDCNVCDTWTTTRLPALLAMYAPCDVFNADETGMFFRMLPDKTMCFQSESCHGGEQSKERVTIMVCANMDGSEKLPLLVIGKFKHPQCFKDIKTLPVNYAFNKRAWMTSSIFEDWLRKQDERFRAQRRHVLMIVDNCPAHPKINNLDAITLVFLPPNATSRLQPCDMGIIKNLKVKYRRLVARHFINCTDAETACEINILDAMQMLRSAWSDVTSQTVASCFRKAGFAIRLCKGASDFLDPAVPETGDDDDVSLECLFPAGGMTFEDYVVADDAVETCEELSDSDIIAEIIVSRNTKDVIMINHSDSEEEDDDEQGPAVVPSTSDAITAIDTLRRFLFATPCSDIAQEQLMAVESFIVKGHGHFMQATLMDYFSSQP